MRSRTASKPSMFGLGLAAVLHCGRAVRLGRSTLRELEALSRLLVPVLLAFDLAGVPGEEPGLAKRRLQVGPMLLEGTGQAEQDRARLAVLAAPLDVHEHVDPTHHLGGDERGADVVALDLDGEV